MATSIPKWVKITQIPVETFSFFTKWLPEAMLDFVTRQKLRHGTLRTIHIYHRAKFGDNNSNSGRDIAIFRFSKWRPGTLRAVHGHQHTKFGEDISNSR